MWSKFRHSKWFIPVVLLLVLVVGVGVVYASSLWPTTNLIGTGSITVTTPAPPASTYSYTLNSTALVFGDHPYTSGDSITIPSQTIYITNTGNTSIGSINVIAVGETALTVWPSWLSISTNVSLPIIAGATNVPLQVVISGTAPGSGATIDLSQFHYAFSPNS